MTKPPPAQFTLASRQRAARELFNETARRDWDQELVEEAYAAPADCIEYEDAQRAVALADQFLADVRLQYMARRSLP